MPLSCLSAALRLLSVFPIELAIDFRKLTLLGQMYRLNSKTCVKTVFLNRLTPFTIHSKGRQIGFIFMLKTHRRGNSSKYVHLSYSNGKDLVVKSVYFQYLNIMILKVFYGG